MAGRNIFIEFSHAPGEVQGGLCAPSDLTKQEFMNMLVVAFMAEGGFEARQILGEDGHKHLSRPVRSLNRRLPHGRYVLTPLCDDVQVQPSDQVYHPRTLSLSATARDNRFRDQIRNRDKRCVISGTDIAAGVWTSFEAAQIFQLALDQGYNNLITHNVPPGVNSPQNGILLRSDVHRCWDGYLLAVNPDNGYAVQSFRGNIMAISYTLSAASRTTRCTSSIPYCDGILSKLSSLICAVPLNWPSSLISLREWI
jgi:HNH endonuclease